MLVSNYSKLISAKSKNKYTILRCNTIFLCLNTNIIYLKFIKVIYGLNEIMRYLLKFKANNFIYFLNEG